MLPNKWQAQDDFWNGFGLPAYDENTVADNAKMPYITYESISGILNGQRQVRASLWYRDDNWAAICQKADEIGQKIYDEVLPAIRINNGFLMVRIPENIPYAQRMEEPDDKEVRRILLTVNMEFLTNY